MEISKDHFIAGVIGGVASLFLAMAARNVMFKHRRGKWMRNRQQSEVVTMNSDNMPAAIGPYSKGKLIKLQDGSSMAYSSGQLGLDPKTNELISDDVEEQAHQVIKNLKALAEDNGMTLQDTVKNVVYLVDMADFAKVNEVYKKYYSAEYPARTCIAIKALPKGGKVEIESVFFKAAEKKGCCAGH
ncbi:endoribonuclease l-psp [Stylonychia lemnae]|uniref:Endoribonuclease l-psp n=1 Tax=Stylonychia lemnae TaxID=5949 RepID=A0A078AYW8_STYLE|nr:endoribonuclease l-psp [Stylonychia lemnae]|eukprot:CDW85988.1 endoribonuclease l-psp [Stylonychia lemnae]